MGGAFDLGVEELLGLGEAEALREGLAYGLDLLAKGDPGPPSAFFSSSSFTSMS